MKLKQLINKEKFEEYFKIIVSHYPEQEKNKKGYELAFNEILSITKDTEHNLQIFIRFEKDDFEDLNYIKVSGIDGTYFTKNAPFLSEDKIPLKDTGNDLSNLVTFAIEYIDWDTWLNCNIFEYKNTKFSDEEIVAHCLYEMTFCGYSNDDIKKQKEKLNSF